MDIKDKVLKFAENYGSAFIVINHPFDNIVFSNNTAKDLYDITLDSKQEDFKVVFPFFCADFKKKIRDGLSKDSYVLQENVITVKSDKTEQLVNLVIGYFNDENTELFLELTPKLDNRLEMAMHQVDNSSKPEAIINLDEKLSIMHFNEYFNDIFESDKESKNSHLNSELINGFFPEIRDKLANDIIKTLKSSRIFSTKIELSTADGEEKWYLFELEKRTLDSSGTDKAIVYLTNIEKQKALENEHNAITKYMSAIQKFTDDIVYIIDYDFLTIHHSMELDEVNPRLKKYGKSFSNYIEVFMKEEIIHPDDIQLYLDGLESYFRDEVEEIQIRFALKTEEYEWYKIKGDKIFDDAGNLTQVVGVLVNIEKEHKIKSEYSILNQYFEGMQRLSNDILFHIDIKTTTFKHNDQNAISFGVPAEIPNYVDFFIENKLIKPECADDFRVYTQQLFHGEEVEYKIQSAVDVGVYHWFHIKSTFIYDENGKPTEIFGTMKNIQEQVDLEQKAHFDALTRVLNRQAFESKVKQDLDTMNYGNTDSFNALIFIDVDNFKFINDNYGHQFGDFILEQFANRMNNCIKETDLIGRIGGDEFVIYLKNLTSSELTLTRANKMLEQMKNNISNGEISHKLGMSLGIAIAPTDGTTFEQLYENADKAVYVSKKRGKNVATLFSDMDKY